MIAPRGAWRLRLPRVAFELERSGLPSLDAALAGRQRSHEDIDRRRLIELRDPVGERLGCGGDGALIRRQRRVFRARGAAGEEHRHEEHSRDGQEAQGMAGQSLAAQMQEREPLPALPRGMSRPLVNCREARKVSLRRLCLHGASPSPATCSIAVKVR